jgi:hypothetical protein
LIFFDFCSDLLGRITYGLAGFCPEQRCSWAICQQLQITLPSFTIRFPCSLIQSGIGRGRNISGLSPTPPGRMLWMHRRRRNLHGIDIPRIWGRGLRIHGVTEVIHPSIYFGRYRSGQDE